MIGADWHLVNTETWTEDAACRGEPPELFFPDPRSCAREANLRHWRRSEKACAACQGRLDAGQSTQGRPMTRFCPACCLETHVDTLTAQACERATIPAREFCGSCGYFHGYIDADVAPLPVAEPASGYLDALAATGWKYASWLAGGVW